MPSSLAWRKALGPKHACGADNVPDAEENAGFLGAGSVRRDHQAPQSLIELVDSLSPRDLKMLAVGALTALVSVLVIFTLIGGCATCANAPAANLVEDLRFVPEIPCAESPAVPPAPLPPAPPASPLTEGALLRARLTELKRLWEDGLLTTSVYERMQQERLARAQYLNGAGDAAMEIAYGNRA